MFKNFFNKLFGRNKYSEGNIVQYKIATVDNPDSEQEMQEKCGVKGYIWRSACDERTCKVCRSRNGKRFYWKYPPEGGHPGYCKLCTQKRGGCRCYAEPDWSSSPFNVD